MNAVLAFHNVPLGAGRLDLAVPAHHTVGVVGDVPGGPGGLCGQALGLDPLPPDAAALVFDHDIGRMARHRALAFRRRVGYVPAGDGLLQNLSLAENVALPLRFGSTLAPREIASRLTVLLAVVRLGDAATLRPAEADAEQRRRAAVARALVFDPALVILEQPFDGVSSRTAAELLEVARGGDTDAGGRRAVFIAGRDLPERLRPRLEALHRVVHGRLITDS